MLEDACHELARQRREVELRVWLVEAVHTLVEIPAREVEVTAVARLVAPWLGGKGGIAAVLQRHATHRLSIDDVVIGRLQGRRVTYRQFLLTPAELGVVLLDRHSL